MSKTTKIERSPDPELFGEVKTLIEQSRQAVAVAVNSTMTMLYWEVGRRVNAEVLNDQRAEYGKQIVNALSSQLVEEYGHIFSVKNLRRMMQFAEVFPEKEIVATLWRQLTWSHIKILIPLEDPLKRSFYIELCKLEKWSVRTLRERVNSMLYERTAISKKPELTIQNELELLQLHKSNIKVADYFTVLPSKQVLMEKYHKAIAMARNNLESRNE